MPWSLMSGVPPTTEWEKSDASAVALGYVETTEPETAARNYTSVLAYMTRTAGGTVPNAEGDYKENLILSMDGATVQKAGKHDFVWD
jgi:hypothetical protein